MGFLGWLAILALLALICRALRSLWKSVDLIIGILILIVIVVVWICEGFWYALLALFICGIISQLFFGMGSGTEVRKFGHKYTLSCNECGYDNLEITEHTQDGVITRCKRCGQICHHTLNH